MAEEHTQEGWRRRPVRKQPRTIGRAAAAFGHDASGRLRMRGGFTLLELAIALGVFVVFATAITTTTISATGTHSQLRAANNATIAVEAALAAVATETGYGDLTVGDIDIPDGQRTVCAEGADGCDLTASERQQLTECVAEITGPRQGCVIQGSRALLVTYSVETENRPVKGSVDSHIGAVRIVAEAALSGGRTVRTSRTITAPSPGASGDAGYVEVILAGDLDDMYAQEGQTFQVHLVNAAGQTIVSETLDPAAAPDRVTLKVETAEINCTRAAPCTVEVDAGRYSTGDLYSSRGADKVVVDRGRLARVAAQLTTGPGVSVQLDVRPTRDGSLRRSPERGSVCLWGSFPHPDRPDDTVYTSWCNSSDPSRVDIRGWDDDGDLRELPETAEGEDGITIHVNPPVEPPPPAPVPPGEQPVVQNVDCTPGTTPGSGIDQVDARMRVYDGAGGWSQDETCTGWTWGMPSIVVYSEVNEAPYVEGQLTVPLLPARDRRITLIWTQDGGAHAAGCTSADPAWSYPREAPAPLDWDPSDPTGDCPDVVGDLAEAPVWTDVTLGGATAQVYYADRITATGVPAPVYTVTGGVLPGGLTLDRNTGELTGVPTTAGSFTFTVQASGSGSISREYTVVVAPLGG